MTDKSFKICRCCLAEKGMMKDMLVDDLILNKKQKIKLHSSYATCSGVNREIGSWRYICKPCEKKLSIVYQFRQQCQESDKELEKRAGDLKVVKKEILLNKEDEFLYTDAKPELGRLPHSFSQVFVKDCEEQIEPVIKIEEEAVEVDTNAPPIMSVHKEEKKDEPEKMEVPADADDTQSIGSEQNFDDRDDNMMADEISCSEDEKSELQSESNNSLSIKKIDATNIDNIPGKIMCYRCYITVHTIAEYKVHQKDCKGNSGILQKCYLCPEMVKAISNHMNEKHKDFKPFECGLCKSTFKQYNNLRTHLFTHITSTKVYCQAKNCKLVCKNPVEFRKHITKNTNHKMNLYHCFLCGFDSPKFLPLLEHYKTTHTDVSDNRKRLLGCFACKQVFCFNKVFRNHECVPVENNLEKIKNKYIKRSRGARTYINQIMSRYTARIVDIDKTPQTCSQCKKVFENDDEFACHQSVCYDPTNNVCSTCGKRFPTVSTLNTHQVIHTNREYICDACGDIFKSKGGLFKHMKLHTIGRIFKCRICPSSFTDKRGLDFHNLIHQEPQYTCDICNKRFKTICGIRLHMGVHLKTKSMSCETCGNEFQRKVQLKRHIQLHHSGIPLLQCGICSKKCYDQAELKRHNLAKHQQIYYECKHCFKHFKNYLGLYYHLFQHRGFYPFNCVACLRKFLTKDRFARHLMKAHGIKFNRKDHGYNEKDLNMRQYLAECKRCPLGDIRDKKSTLNMEIDTNDLEPTVVPEPLVGQVPPINAISSSVTEVFAWKPANLLSLEGYGQ